MRDYERLARCSFDDTQSVTRSDMDQVESSQFGTIDELCAFGRECKAPKLRSMRAFAEQEIILPSGEFYDRKFSCSRQPFSGVWFDAVDSGLWPELVITGPSQSGKTLIGFVIPVLYHLFEMQETVIAAVPNDDMVRDKWEQDIEPVLARTRYRDLLPRRGAGSKGGRVDSIKFTHGPILRFMTSGGNDKARAGFTSRVICMTETDGFDVRTSTSIEANKIEQIEARARSFALRRRRIYKECTLTTTRGHTHQRIKAGTDSRLVIPCPHCRSWVSPEREHLIGWQDETNIVKAVQATSFCCPACGELWTEQERHEANREIQVIHRGQSLEDGVICGEPDPTFTLGFRWSAVNNLLVPAGDIAADEFAAARAIDEDDAQRKMCQFVWAMPYEPLETVRVDLDAEELKKRQMSLGRGQVPAGTRWVTVGVDVNQAVLHWTAIAWMPEGNRGHVLDYGKQPVNFEQVGFEIAIARSVKDLHESLGSTWTATKIDRVGVDSRWMTDEVCAAVKQLRDGRWRAFTGHGKGHYADQGYYHPDKVAGDIIWIGNQCHEKVNRKRANIVMHASANYWKTWLHNRLRVEYTEEASEGAISLFGSMNQNEHMTFCRHITAEKETVSFENGKGYVKSWEAIREANHYLDSTYIACVMAHRCGFDVVKKLKSAVKPSRPAQVTHDHQVEYGGTIEAPQFIGTHFEG